MAVTSHEVAVTLVTSASYFEGNRSGMDPAARESLMESFLAQMREHAWGEPKVLVVPGGKAVHDRFIVVDGRAWLSGNSLNAIGDRPSVMIRIPNPGFVLDKLKPSIDRATPFVEWLAHRREARGRRPTPPPPRNVPEP